MYDGYKYSLSRFVIDPSCKALSLVDELRSLQRLREYVRVHLGRPHMFDYDLLVLHTVRWPEVSDVDVTGAFYPRFARRHQRHSRGVVLVEGHRAHLVPMVYQEPSQV